jgi:hypothetical protein
MTASVNQLVRVTYPNGAVAYAPIFEDGTYYGSADVAAGLAVAEPSYDCPLDRYHAWLAHTPTPILEDIELCFARLLRAVGPDSTRRIIERISCSEVYTHFRRGWEGN